MKQIKTSFYAFLFCGFALASSLVQACSCIPPSTDTDAATLEYVDLIGRFEVVDRKQIISLETGILGEIVFTLRADEIYYGSVNYNDSGMIVSKIFQDSCSFDLDEGSIHDDLMLFIKDDEYWVAGMCNDLSEEGWKRLKSSEYINNDLPQ